MKTRPSQEKSLCRSCRQKKLVCEENASEDTTDITEKNQKMCQTDCFLIFVA